jgi:molybdopterin-guanine dinucleotide biosynthesis protein A
MVMNAIVLAGGRSSRLAGTPKARLLYRGTTLLDLAVKAATDAGARRVVVVGATPTGVGGRILLTREDPPFGGPVAGIGAGVLALEGATGTEPTESGDLTLVLACDLPHVARAVAALTAALPMPAEADGLMLVDGERMGQPLTALYRSAALGRALSACREHGGLDGLSMRALIRSLRLHEVASPAGATDDVDTPEDAKAYGIHLS